MGPEVILLVPSRAHNWEHFLVDFVWGTFSCSSLTHTPGSVRGIRDEGMPRFRHPDLKGNLYIRFDVEFPENNYLDEKGLKVH